MPNRGIRKKRKKLVAKSGLTKKETSHIREFGELHPAFESSSEEDSDDSKPQTAKNGYFSDKKFEKKPVLSEPKRKLNLEKIESILKADSEAVPKHSYEELLDCLSSVESDAESNDDAVESENEEQQSSDSENEDVQNSDLGENGIDGETAEDYETNLADVDLDSADEVDNSKLEHTQEDTVDESAEQRSANESNGSASASDSDGERTTSSTGAKKRKRKLIKADSNKKRKVVSAFKRHLETELSRNTLEALRSGTSSLQSGNGEFETVKWTYAGLNEVDAFLSGANFRDPFRVIAHSDTLRDAAFCWNAAHGSLRMAVSRDAPLSIAQRELAALAFNYFDVYYAPHRSAAPALNDHRLVYTLHALSHVLRARNVVVKHNLRLRSAAEVRSRRTLTQLRKDKRARKARGELAAPVREYRDQQFTRPKVLIVVPFRESAKRIVTLICELLAGGGTTKPRKKAGDAEAEAKSDRTRLGKLQILNKRRFLEEYGDPDGDGEADSAQRTGGSKPPDFTETFAGNIDDHFRIGVSVKKRSVRLYAEFYSSDIIIASPLGLRTLICPTDGEDDDDDGENVRDAKATKSKQDDADFLSSIELLVVDQADVIEMQNLEHLHYVLDHLNLMPRASHGIDLSRVRMWALDGASRHYRQTLFFAAQPTLDTLGAFHQSSRNFEGRFVLLDQPRTASLAQVLVPHKHVFLRVPSASFASAPDARFDYFVNQLLPKWFDSSSGSFERRHVLVFVASYFDYVRLRNHFRRTDANVALLSEYADSDAVMTARGLFYAGRVPLALYTERMHFYHRYRIRGVRHVIFYQMPRYAHYYAEVCNWLLDPAARRRRRREAQDEPAQSSTAADAPDDCSITVLFNRFDRYQLEGVLGHERTMRMIGSATSDFDHATSSNTFVYYAAK